MNNIKKLLEGLSIFEEEYNILDEGFFNKKKKEEPKYDMTIEEYLNQYHRKFIAEYKKALNILKIELKRTCPSNILRGLNIGPDEGLDFLKATNIEQMKYAFDIGYAHYYRGHVSVQCLYGSIYDMTNNARKNPEITKPIYEAIASANQKLNGSLVTITDDGDWDDIVAYIRFNKTFSL